MLKLCGIAALCYLCSACASVKDDNYKSLKAYENQHLYAAQTADNLGWEKQKQEHLKQAAKASADADTNEFEELLLGLFELLLRQGRKH